MTIYFAAHGERIKIGYTRGPLKRRLDAIARNLPGDLEIIGHIPGPRVLEQEIHKHLKKYRLKGEWFTDCAETRRSIRQFILASDQIEIAETKHHPHLKPSAPRSEAEYGAMLGELADLIWPHTAASGFAEFASVNIQQAMDWFDGKGIPPRLTRLAFASHVLAWMFQERT